MIWQPVKTLLTAMPGAMFNQYCLPGSSTQPTLARPLDDVVRFGLWPAAQITVDPFLRPLLNKPGTVLIEKTALLSGMYVELTKNDVE